MPCRPASHEFSVDDGTLNRERAVRLLARRVDTNEVLLAWATDPASSIFRPTQEKIESVLAQSVDQPIASCPIAVRPGDREIVGEWSMDMAFRQSREEKLLCEARCVLALLMREAGPPPPPIAAAVDEQLAAHRTHRVGDLNAAREALQSTIAHLLSGRPTSNSTARVIALRERLTALDQMDDDELWENRAALEKIWP